MELKKDNRLLIEASAKRAFAGVTVKTLAGVCYQLTEGGITLSACFTKPLDEADRETVSVAFTEMLADLHSCYANWKEEFLEMDAEGLPATEAEWLYSR
jgi:hypothetical protein